MNRLAIIGTTLIMPLAGWGFGKWVHSLTDDMPKTTAPFASIPNEGMAEQIRSLNNETPLESLTSQELTERLKRLQEREAPSAEALEWRERLYAELAARDPAAFVALFRHGLAGAEQRDRFLACIERLTKTDPASTARLISTLPGGWQQADAWKKLAQTGAVSDPENTLALAESLGRFRRTFLRDLVATWSDTDPAAAIKAASRPEHLRDLDTWFRVAADPKVLAKWFRKDAKEALEWLGDLPISESFRDSLTYSLGNEMRGDTAAIEALPEDARQALIDWIGPEQHAWQRTESEVRALAETDPEAAFDRAVAQLGGPLNQRGRLVTAMLEKLVELDPETAFEKAMALPGRRQRHHFFKAYGKSAAEEAAPDILFEWARQLDEPAAQTGAIEGVFESWVTKDFAAAFEALATRANEPMSAEFAYRVKEAASAENLLGQEANQEAVATLLEAFPANQREDWLLELQRNLNGTLPRRLAALEETAR